MPEATVLIPTFDHGPLIRHALASAQGQTLRDLEIFVVGDGAPDVTREIVESAAATDSRIRYFENPKGEGRGERHRHQALAEAAGGIVCYLGDDDLWLPDHVASLRDCLATVDFACAMNGRVRPDGTIRAQAFDIAQPFFRHYHERIGNRIFLSSVGHRLAAYRRLPGGWGPAPPRQWSNVHMWRQFFALGDLQAASTWRPSCLSFASGLREHMTLAEREREMGDWRDRLAEPTELERIRQDILVAHLRHALEQVPIQASLRGWLARHPALHRAYLRLRGRPIPFGKG